MMRELNLFFRIRVLDLSCVRFVRFVKCVFVCCLCVSVRESVNVCVCERVRVSVNVCESVCVCLCIASLESWMYGT